MRTFETTPPFDDGGFDDGDDRSHLIMMTPWTLSGPQMRIFETMICSPTTKTIDHVSALLLGRLPVMMTMTPIAMMTMSRPMTMRTIHQTPLSHFWNHLRTSGSHHSLPVKGVVTPPLSQIYTYLLLDGFDPSFSCYPLYSFLLLSQAYQLLPSHP